MEYLCFKVLMPIFRISVVFFFCFQFHCWLSFFRDLVSCPQPSDSSWRVCSEDLGFSQFSWLVQRLWQAAALHWERPLLPRSIPIFGFPSLTLATGIYPMQCVKTWGKELVGGCRLAPWLGLHDPGPGSHASTHVAVNSSLKNLAGFSLPVLNLFFFFSCCQG